METDKIFGMAEAYVNYALDNLEKNRRDAVYAENAVLEIR